MSQSQTSKAPAAKRSNLPAQPTRLIGREQELASARELLLRDGVRMLTFTGPPGTGKTRLAIEVAADMAEQFERGVYFIDLAPITEPALIASAIAQPLGVREAGRMQILDSLKDYLWDRHILLLLDNFEHVLEGAPLLGDLLAACPAIKVAVTSRAALRLRWEHEFAVPPLALPDLRLSLRVDELACTAAVLLFIERARVAQPDFALTPENAGAVAEICVRLDGLPLPIELAAAQSRLFPPQSMLPRLESRLQLLAAGPRDVPQRHQTLRGAIGWSYSLLQAGERTLFRRLGIFTGGCGQEAAEVVCGTPGHLGPKVAEGIAALLENNLLQREHRADGGVRFRMLETVREYALECLEASREVEGLRQRHAAYYLSLAERAETELAGPGQVAWLEQLDGDLDNLRAAARWLLEHGEAKLSVQLATALWPFWWRRGHLTEGRQWLAEIIALGQLASPTALRAQALLVGGLLALWQADYAPARTLLSESLAIARAVDDMRTLAFSLTFLGRVARDMGDEEACVLGTEAVERFRQLNDAWALAVALHFLGLAVAQRDPAAAYPLFEESAALFRERGNKWDLAMPLRGLGIVAYQQGDYKGARTLFGESVALFRDRGDEWSAAMALHDLGNTARSQGDSRQAALLFAESLRSWRRLGNVRGISMCLAGLAGVAAARGLATRAALLFGVAEAIGSHAGIILEPTGQTGHEHILAGARVTLGEEAFAAAWAEGEKLSLEAAVIYALELEPPPQRPSKAETGHEAGRLDLLTPREREVAGLLAQGLTNRQIAAALVIAEGTANLHVKHILGKLGLASRAQVGIWATKQGLGTGSPSVPAT